MVGRYLLINIVRISRVSYIVLLLTICITFFEASFTLFVKCRREEGRAVDRPGRMDWRLLQIVANGAADGVQGPAVPGAVDDVDRRSLPPEEDESEISLRGRALV